MMPTAKKKLAAPLKTALKRRFGTLKKAADEAGIDYSALRKSLSKNENRYYRTDLDSLCRVLGWPTGAKLKEEYTFDTLEGRRGARGAQERHEAELDRGEQDLGRAFGTLFAQAGRLRGAIAAIDKTVQNLYASMGRGDVLVLVLSDEEAIEWTVPHGSPLFDLVAAAVARGACICYIVPSKTIVESILTSSAAIAKEPQVFQRLFAAFRLRVDAYARQNVRPGSPNAKKPSPGYLVAIEHQSPAYFAPGHKFALYVHVVDAKERQSLYWAVAAYPIATGKYTGEPVADRLVLPLMKDVAKHLLLFSQFTVEAALNSDGNDDSKKTALTEVLTLLRGGAAR